MPMNYQHLCKEKEFQGIVDIENVSKARISSGSRSTSLSDPKRRNTFKLVQTEQKSYAFLCLLLHRTVEFLLTL